MSVHLSKKGRAENLFSPRASIIAAFCLLLLPGACMAKNALLKVEFSNLARVLMWEEAPGAFARGGVKLCSGRERIGAAERWMDIVVKLDSESYPLESTFLSAEVRGAEYSGRPLAETKVPAGTPHALVRVDMRTLGKEDAKLVVKWLDAKDRLLGMGELWVSAGPAAPLAPGTRIPVKIDVPEGGGRLEGYPVRFGVPLPRGAVWKEEGLRVVDSGGREIPSQLEAAGLWAEEGSVKWMWVDALVTGSEDIYVEAGDRTGASAPAVPVSVEKAGEALIVRTGAAEYRVGMDGALIKEVIYNGKAAAREGSARGLYVVDQKGRLATASGKDTEMKVESAGPVSAVVRIEGFYRTAGGEEVARHITRLHFHAGRAGVEAVHTLVLTRDTNEVWFRDIGWELETAPGFGDRGLFSLSPGEPGKSFSLPLRRGKIFTMMQKDGVKLGLRPVSFRSWRWTHRAPQTPMEPFLYGENSFEIRDGGRVVLEGGAMGDWFSVEGKNTGLMFSCRDAAAQHPKEFEASRDRINLKLFTSSSGKELDFRMEALMKNWGIAEIEKIEFHEEVPREMLEENLDVIRSHSTNAAGWARTHEVLFSPYVPGENPGKLSLFHSKRVFAHVSPGWIRETRVIGPLHPLDRENFPLEETLIEKMFRGKVKQRLGFAEGGFIDYFSGPYCSTYSWRDAYSFRSDSWYLYARSADRYIREFAQGTNRAFLDNNLSHWHAKDKTPGLINGHAVSAGSYARRSSKNDLPLYWEGKSEGNYEISTTANLNQALFDYYLTGYRRAGDIVENYARAAKENLTTETTHWRVILAVRHLAQAYELTWEPRLKELVYELTERYIYDPKSPVLLTKTRPHRSSTYKMQTDGDVFIDLYRLFGDRLFYDMATAIARYNWDKSDIVPPVPPAQNRSTGFMGHFLWEETGEASLAERFNYSRRRLVAENPVNVETGEVSLLHVSQLPRYFKGLPLAMDVLTRIKEKGREGASWMAFNACDSPVRLFFIKPGKEVADGQDDSGEVEETSIELLLRKEGAGSVEHFKGREENGVLKPWTTGGRIILKPHAAVAANKIWPGHDLHEICEKSSGIAKIKVPVDAPAGLYEVEIEEEGAYSVFANSLVPLALYAPGGWKPLRMNPPVRTYFRVPGGKEGGGRIFFEKKTSLFNPDGELFGKGLWGWVEIPPGKPGLWGFESVDPGKVKTDKLPAFFTMGAPGLYADYDKSGELDPEEMVSGTLSWPSTWRVFGPVEEGDEPLPETVLNAYPEKIEVGGKSFAGKDVEVSGTVFDFPVMLKNKASGTVAYAFLLFKSPREQEVTLGMGADWWMQAWVNGKLIHDTTETSNIHYPFSIWNHLVKAGVKRGENILAVRFIRGGGSTLAIGGPDQLRATPVPVSPGEKKASSGIEGEFNLFLTGTR